MNECIRALKRPRRVGLGHVTWITSKNGLIFFWKKIKPEIQKKKHLDDKVLDRLRSPYNNS
jgi:hypothetical protein